MVHKNINKFLKVVERRSGIRDNELMNSKVQRLNSEVEFNS